MTRLYTSIITVLMTFMAVAAMQPSKAEQKKQGVYAGMTVDAQNTLDSRDALSRGAKSLKLPTAPASGEVKSYLRTAYTYYEMMGGVYASYVDAFVSNVVFDGKDVYIQDPVAEFPTGGYIQGTLDGDKITFAFPQSIGSYQGSEVFVNLFKLEYTDVDNGKVMYYIAPEDENTMTMTISADGTIEMDKAEIFDEDIDMPSYVLGLNLADGYWSGYAEWDAVYSQNSNVSQERPDGLTFDKYQMRYNEMAGMEVSIGIDGNSMYLSGLSEHFPDACVVGTIKDNKVAFASKQYLGVDEEWHEDCFFWTFYMEWGYDDYYGMEGWLIYETEELVMDYDPANKTLTADQSFLFNLGNTELCYTKMFKQPKIVPLPETFVAAAPENPRFDQVDEYNPDENYNYARMAFSLPMFNVNGNLMELDKLYYNVYFGETLYTFDPEVFIHLTAPMVDIPYLFTDIKEYGGYEIKNMGDIDHYIYFDNQPDIKMSQVGLQLIYKDDDNTLYKSDIVYYDQSGVEDMTVGVGSISHIFYYDLLGRKVATPKAGAYVKVTVRSDGSQKSEKVMFK